MILNIPIKLYYNADGTMYLGGEKNVVPYIMKLSNLAYQLQLVCPYATSNYSFQAFFQKADNTTTNGYPMSNIGTENVNGETWYIYACQIESEVISVSGYGRENLLGIGFYITDGNTTPTTLNTQPFWIRCTYAVTGNQSEIEETPLENLQRTLDLALSTKTFYDEVVLHYETPPHFNTQNYKQDYVYLLIDDFTDDDVEYKTGDILIATETGYELLSYGKNTITDIYSQIANIQTAYLKSASIVNGVLNITKQDDTEIAFANIYECTYGTTTYSQVSQALTDKKIPYLNYENRLYIYEKSYNGAYIFNSTDDNVLYKAVLPSNNVWTNFTLTFENQANKKTTMTNNDTDYPTTKAVVDYVDDINSQVIDVKDNYVRNITKSIDNKKITIKQYVSGEENEFEFQGGSDITIDDVLDNTSENPVQNKVIYEALANTKELFECSYGTTTYADITTALSAGKVPVCFYENKQYVYVGLSTTDRHTFSSQLFDSNRYISVNSSDSWGIGLNNFEIISNKVTSISSSSTNTQYPSAKLVYDQLALKVDKEVGKGLSTNDFTDAYKNKVDSAIQGVKVNNTALTPTDNVVNVEVPTKTSDLQNDGEGGNTDDDKFATKGFVNSSIETSTATFRGTYNLVSDLSLTISATETEIGTAIATKLATEQITANNNDYVFVQVPTANNTPTIIDHIDRYKYVEVNNVGSWVYEYTLNNSGFTQAQWDAINSAITATKVTDYDNHLLNTSNPHNVTKEQVGLGNVDNTSDATKKTNFTGSIASGNTGFATGGAVYNALADKQNTIDGSNKLDADLVDDETSTNKFVTSNDISNWNGKQDALPTTTGNTGKVLKVGSSGLEWATDNDTTYTAGSNIAISGGAISVNSGSATSGKVLTADGSGGATWGDASSVTFVDWS